MDNRETTELIIKKAIKNKIKLSFAESCTGGMVSALFTEIPGVSEIFMGSAVTYSNEAKHSLLGVSEETLAKHGAVSSECACEMAEGSRRIYNSDIAMSITGIAGPDGGTPEKPVGTVWFGYADKSRTISFKKEFKGSREQVRAASVKQILFTLSEELK